MKIFLTGGTGFIGSHFINKAHEAGHKLVCLRRQGSHPRIALIHEPIWVEGSLENNLQSELKGCDILLHLAAHSTNVPYDNIEKCLYWNMTVSLQLLQQAREVGVKNFIVTGTGFEYGQSGEEHEFISVDAPLKPTMSYPASKAAASIVFSQWAIEHKLKLKYLRIFQVFGEGEDENRLWPSLKKAAISGEDYNLTPGEQIRDFTPVQEVAKQLVDNLNFLDIKAGEPLTKHVGTDNPQSIKQFAEYWWDKWDAKGKLHFGTKSYRKNEVMRFVPDVPANYNEPIVAVVMLRFNGLNRTLNALEAVKNIDYNNKLIILVDNGSTDGGIHTIKKEYPDILFIEHRNNLSYCAAYNSGILLAIKKGAMYISMVHNDSVDYSLDYLSVVVKTFQKDNQIALVGTKVYNADGSLDWGGENHPRLGIDMNTPTCGYTISTEAFDNVGLMDEKLGIFYEDLDFIHRLRKRGYKTKFTDNVSYVHLGSGTVQRIDYFFHYFRTRNMLWFIKKLGKDISLKHKIIEIKGGLKTHFGFLFFTIRKRMFKKSIIIAYAITRGLLVGIFKKY